MSSDSRTDVSPAERQQVVDPQVHPASIRAVQCTPSRLGIGGARRSRFRDGHYKYQSTHSAERAQDSRR